MKIFLEDNKHKAELLRKFAFLLKTPRMHHEYIKRNGIDPFITKFTALLAENKTLHEEIKRNQDRLLVR